jgi:predicted DNA-binding transcriptional regulator YafY
MPELELDKVVAIVYTNYRGETDRREIIPIRQWFGSTDWHREAQWLLDAYDLSKAANRTFAMKDIHSWEAGRAASRV